MPTHKNKDERALAAQIVKAASEPERAALLAWGEAMLRIRESNADAAEKAMRALSETADEKVALPMLQLLGREAKRVGWDERSLSERVGLSAATFGLTMRSAVGVGIAAMGGVVAVPMWVVFGSGGSQLEALVDELRRQRPGAPRRRSATGPVRRTKKAAAAPRAAAKPKTASRNRG